MDRRKFIQRAAVAGTTAGIVVASARAEGNATVTFNVKGFTCITCAVGLEVILREHKGVVRAKASYPNQQVTIGFDSAAISEDNLKEFINKTTGFTVQREPSN